MQRLYDVRRHNNNPPGWIQNDNGFLRMNGASYSMETRQNVIRLYEIYRRDLERGTMSWEQLALMAGPSKKFCMDLAGKHDRNESIQALPSVPNPVVKFDEAGIEALFSIYEENPSYILCEYKDILLMRYDMNASESTICDLLNHELDLTLKLVTIDRAKKYTEANELMAVQYWQDIGICEPSTVKCFDECAVVAKRHEAPLARAPRGQRVVWTIPNPEKYRLSVNGLTVPRRRNRDPCIVYTYSVFCILTIIHDHISYAAICYLHAQIYPAPRCQMMKARAALLSTSPDAACRRHGRPRQLRGLLQQQAAGWCMVHGAGGCKDLVRCKN
jgi:hypothetical protein